MSQSEEREEASSHRGRLGGDATRGKGMRETCEKKGKSANEREKEIDKKNVLGGCSVVPRVRERKGARDRGVTRGNTW